MTKSLIKKLLLYSFSVFLLLTVVFFFWWCLSWSIIPLKNHIEYPKGNFDLAQPLPIARTESNGIVCNGSLYQLGGLNEFAQTLQDFYRYDSSKKEWQQLPDLPQPINHPGIATHQNLIFVVGGFGALGINLRGAMIAKYYPKKTLYAYHIQTKKWYQLADLPEARGAGGCTCVGDTIWYSGGINEQKKVTNSLFGYSISKNKWFVAKHFCIARDHHRMEAVDGNLYVISGRQDDIRFTLTSVEQYHIANNSWKDVKAIPLGRGGLGSAVHNGLIYTFGGELLWHCLDNFECYNPVTDEWQILPALPEGRHGIVGGFLGNTLHLVSGGKHPRISVSSIHRTFILKK